MLRKVVVKEEGIELIEFVGLMPIVFILGLIIWQVMVFFHTQMVTANAAREGARALSAYEYNWLPFVETDVEEAVRNTRQGHDYRCGFDFILFGISCGSISGGCIPFVGPAGLPAIVTVELRLPILTIPFVPIPEIWTRSRAVTMCEEPDGIGF